MENLPSVNRPRIYILMYRHLSELKTIRLGPSFHHYSSVHQNAEVKTLYPKLLLCESKQNFRILLRLRICVNIVQFLNKFPYVNSPFCDVVILYASKKYLKSDDDGTYAMSTRLN